MSSFLGFKRRSDRERDEQRRADKERKRRALAGNPEGWLGYDFFMRAKERGIVGIPDERCFTLQSVIRSLRDIEGDVAECGVRLGKSSVFLLEADLRRRAYHLFDSFEGLSEPSAEDSVPESGEAYWKKGDISTPEAETRANLARYDNVHIHRGWIPERFPDVADGRFALVHLDVDLYEPTRDGLDFFWPRIVAGGVLVCDDYGSRRCPGAKKALDEFAEANGVALLELSTGQSLTFKR